ncbi:hypothetical protein G9A89_016537 [Geosiphon pyriformis]|nr:hypothetical protein G9A89_016537 [Geosiphon pyriformis]
MTARSMLPFASNHHLIPKRRFLIMKISRRIISNTSIFYYPDARENRKKVLENEDKQDEGDHIDEDVDTQSDLFAEVIRNMHSIIKNENGIKKPQLKYTIMERHYKRMYDEAHWRFYRPKHRFPKKIFQTKWKDNLKFKEIPNTSFTEDSKTTLEKDDHVVEKDLHSTVIVEKCEPLPYELDPQHDNTNVTVPSETDDVCERIPSIFELILKEKFREPTNIQCSFDYFTKRERFKRKDYNWRKGKNE